jgi:cytochrome c peroxidase
MVRVMKAHSILLTLGLSLQALAQKSQTVPTVILDLTRLHSYADQEVPAYVNRDNTPPDNPITDIGATLGRVLFYDKNLSRNNTISCASCHQQEHAFGDTALASTGVAGTTGRHSMRLVNARFGTEPRFFWDERAPSLEAQTTQPIQDHIEMGFSGADGDPDFSALVARISDMELYQVLFTAVFGSPGVTEERIQSALAQFIRSIQSFDSKYDEGLSSAQDPNANFANFTAQENLGKRLFTDPPGPGAGCAVCHRPPTFDITPNSGHNGVIGSLGGGTDPTNTRSPSLRDVVDKDGNPHGPFMHDGSKATLLDVINHYNAIPAITPGLDPRLAGPPPGPGRPPGGGGPQRLNLTDQEKEALIAFLGTLTGTSIYTDEKWSSPFDENNELSFVVIQTHAKMARESDQMVLRGKGVPQVTYLLKSSADLKTWDEGIEVTANADGELIHVMDDASDKGFFSFVYQPGN